MIPETATLRGPRVNVFFEGTWFRLPADVTTIDQAMVLGPTLLDVPDAQWQT